jgi:hypothetical protein
MLLAFGAVGGALAADHDWPIWAQFRAGITAGWPGFEMFKLIVAGTSKFAKQFLDNTGNSDAP